jgi:hypothetical protein
LTFRTFPVSVIPNTSTFTFAMAMLLAILSASCYQTLGSDRRQPQRVLCTAG